MKITVTLPKFLEKIKGTNALELEFPQDGVKLIDVLRELENQLPEAKGRILQESGKPNRFITYYINDEDSRFFQFCDTPLKEGDKVGLLSAIAGG